MHDVSAFRRVLSGITEIELETLVSRCAGAKLKDVAERDGVSSQAVADRLKKIRRKVLKVTPGEFDDGIMTGDLCYRLGYERALSDMQQAS